MRRLLDDHMLGKHAYTVPLLTVFSSIANFCAGVSVLV
jgi:hypothetical protein